MSVADVLAKLVVVACVVAVIVFSFMVQFVDVRESMTGLT